MKNIARADIKPAFAERNVPVALATDENYLPYLKVAINSAIASSPGSNLDIIVLCAGIPEDAVRTFVAGYARVGNASVRFVDISDELETSGLSDYKQTARLPLSACYRLLLPRVLAAYGKVVYLDVDVAVCRDLGELYATDVGDNYFAAAKDVVYNTKPEYVSWAADWGFTEWDGYVNTGVLVMNLERFRREPVFDRLLPVVLEASKWLCDQDALNFVCKGAIAPLDPRWNVQLGDYCLPKQIALTGEEMWIAHYTGGEKPWEHPSRRYSHHWWLRVGKLDISCLWMEAWGDAHVHPVAEKPKVSVVVPVYNTAKYLPEALASVLMQKDFPEIEVICIDDGSTDDSAAILDFWAKRDSRLRVVHQTNQGPGVARNAGLDVAEGEYIFFLDPDDRLFSGAALRLAYGQAKSDDLDILIADATNLSESGRAIQRNVYIVPNLIPEARVFSPEDLGVNIYIVTTMGPSAKLLRRKFIQEKELRFPPLRRSEDFPMVQLAMSLARRIGVLLRPLMEHRIGVATSLESTKDETPLIFAEAEEIFRKSLADRGLLGRFGKAGNAAHLLNLAYNLRKVCRFSSFKAIAGYCAEEFPKLGLKGDEVDVEAFPGSFKRIESIAAVARDTDRLAEIFADIQISKRLHAHGDSAMGALAAKDKALEQLRGRTVQLRGNLEKQREAVKVKDVALEQLRGNAKRLREAIAAKDAALEQLRGATAQLRGNLEKLREAIAAKDAALGQLRDNVEKQRMALAPKDSALEQLRGVVSQLRGNAEKQRKALTAKDAALEKLRSSAEKQREALASKDAALEQLHGAVSQLKGNAERQRKALTTKDAALEKLRGNVEKQREALAAKDTALEKLRGNVEKQRKALAAKDAALEQLRGNAKKERKTLAAKDTALGQLRGNAEKQREALAAKDAALVQLRGNAEKQRKALVVKDTALEKLRGNAEKQRKVLAAKDAALKQLRGNVEKQREALVAKDTALKQLRGVVLQLKGSVEKQREALAAKDAALEQLRNVVAQLKRNAEKQREVIVAKNESIAEQSAAITSLRRGIDGKQRLLDKYERTIGKLKGAIDL